MSELQENLTRARQLAGTARGFAIFALVVIIVSIVVKTGIPLGSLLFSASRDLPLQLSEVGVLLVQVLPAALLCQAVNSLRQALDHYCEGDFFSREASRQVAAAGDYGVQAMIALMLIVPNLSEWIQGQGGFTIRVESETLGVLAFALFVGAVGRILSAAASLKEENEAFI